jgi:hypothetical protein
MKDSISNEDQMLADGLLQLVNDPTTDNSLLVVEILKGIPITPIIEAYLLAWACFHEDSFLKKKCLDLIFKGENMLLKMTLTNFAKENSSALGKGYSMSEASIILSMDICELSGLDPFIHLKAVKMLQKVSTFKSYRERYQTVSLHSLAYGIEKNTMKQLDFITTLEIKNIYQSSFPIFKKSWGLIPIKKLIIWINPLETLDERWFFVPSVECLVLLKHESLANSEDAPIVVLPKSTNGQVSLLNSLIMEGIMPDKSPDKAVFPYLTQINWT